jgi:hypothetical protein
MQSYLKRELIIKMLDSNKRSGGPIINWIIKRLLTHHLQFL